MGNIVRITGLNIVDSAEGGVADFAQAFNPDLGMNLVGMGDEDAKIRVDCLKEDYLELRDGGVGGLNRRTGDLDKPYYTPVRVDEASRITDEEENVLE